MEMKNGNGATQNGNSFRPEETKRDPKVSTNCTSIESTKIFSFINQPTTTSTLKKPKKL